MITPTLDLERILAAQGYDLIAGFDEVGRGALAGPVMVGCAAIWARDLEPLDGDDAVELSGRTYLGVPDGVADSLVGHGGIFATPKVAQKILAAAFNTPIKVMSTAAEGGAWGMAVLANYLWNTNEDHSNLADFLDGCVFKDAQSTTEKPVASDVVGFEDFFARFTKGLPIEHAAIETINLEDK